MSSLTESDGDGHGAPAECARTLPSTKLALHRPYSNYGNYGRVIYSIAVDRSRIRPVTTEYVKGLLKTLPTRPSLPFRSNIKPYKNGGVLRAGCRTCPRPITHCTNLPPRGDLVVYSIMSQSNTEV